jgi:hypothetical protein
LGATTLLGDLPPVPPPLQESRDGSKPLHNINLQTAIGLGDEPATIVDRLGQLNSRNVGIRLEAGANLAPAGSSAWRQWLQGAWQGHSDMRQPATPTIPSPDWRQWLEDGYSPVVSTELRSPQGSLRAVAFSSDFGGIRADYVGMQVAKMPWRLTLLFPFVTSVKAHRGVVTSHDRILAFYPFPNKGEAVFQGKYNLLTPASRSRRFEALSKPLSDSDPAFAAGRLARLNRWIEYRFPVPAGKTYHVYLGFLVREPLRPGGMVLRLSVNGQQQVLDLGVAGRGNKPVVREFAVTPSQGEIRVKSDCDPSSLHPYRDTVLNGIWIFDAPVDPQKVMAGKLSQAALYYVQCGREAIADLATSLVIEYEPEEAAAEPRWIRLPYDLRREETGKASGISPQSAEKAATEHWSSLVAKGAEYSTGVPRLDSLYKTSLLNIFLLRTKFPSRRGESPDLYVVKPGATWYDTFWYRDGSYIVNALDVAGYPEEAGKCLRLFYRQDLTGRLAPFGQQRNGAWQYPPTQWDGQGQALWALVQHFALTGDKKWLREIYPCVRRGALWIRDAIEQSKTLSENGEKPIYYGLLPIGEGEGIGNGYVYYHNYWAILGLREAIAAAEALHEQADLKWMREAYRAFHADLLASVKLAHEHTGNSRFIPGTPFDPGLEPWSAMTALYPTRFLDPHDPMLTGNLELLARHSQEDNYTFFTRKKIFTYLTVDWAMCYLLRDELPMFCKLFNGFVAHASPTNAWTEEIYLDSRIGTGDMPHGWAAADYVLLHRACLVYENERKLELCWGVQPDWLAEGAKISARRAPSRFGEIDFQMRRSGAALLFDYKLAARAGQPAASEVRLHIPALKDGVKTVRINGKERVLAPAESVITLTA